MTVVSKASATAASGLETAMREILDQQKAAHIEAGPAPLTRRKAKLDKLLAVVRDNQDILADAVNQDFGNRSKHETLLAEIFPVISSIRYMRKNLAKWMRPERRHTEITFKPATTKVVYQPLGSVGIIAPWNYPIQLALVPLATALAAGNRAMLKPSELTPKTSEVLHDILSKAFDEDEVAVILGGIETGQAFSSLPFDHLVYTGSTSVGRLVMQAAAANLTPVTLELGGKSPTLITDDYPLDKAAESIIGGKLLNAGQTCVAPDYVLVPRNQMDTFIQAAKDAVGKFYPTLKANPDYTSVVNDRHFGRLMGLLDEARQAETKIVEINPANESLKPEGRKIAPTLLVDPKDDLKVMQDEIFGPLMPLVPYDTLDEALAYINARPRPLALYVYANKPAVIDRVTRETTAGGMCINETLMHVAQDDIPFGGVGPSGMGAYHGIEGFKALSHAKSVFHQSPLNGIGFLRPPYGKLIEMGLSVLIGKRG